MDLPGIHKPPMFSPNSSGPKASFQLLIPSRGECPDAQLVLTLLHLGKLFSGPIHLRNCRSSQVSPGSQEPPGASIAFILQISSLGLIQSLLISALECC